MVKIAIALLVISIVETTISLRGVIFEKIACEPNPLEIYDSTCNMTKLDQFRSNISFAFTVKQSQPKVSIRLQMLKKVKKSTYVPAFFDVTVDVCSLNIKNNPMFQSFLPGVREQMEKYMHPCPYSVKE
jgi:Protein of unknown function (DUF1091)